MKRQKTSNRNDGAAGKGKDVKGGQNDCLGLSNEEMAHVMAAGCVCHTTVSPQAIMVATGLFHPTFRLDADKLSSSCMDIYRLSREKVQEFLKNFDGQVSLSVDVLGIPGGSSSIGYLGYKRQKDICLLGFMCVRVHLIDEKYKLRNLVLDFTRADAELYVEPILKCLEDFNIMTKISSIMVLDGFDGEKISAAIKSKIPGTQKPPHMLPVRCCAALLCLLVEDAFEAIKVNKFLELDGCNRALGPIPLQTECGLPMWNIILGQLKNTLECEATGDYDNDDIRTHHDMPSAEEWKRLRGVCRLASLVNDAAEVLYKTNNVTASLYLYNLQKLRAALIRESVSSDQFVSQMALNMLQQLYQYWKDMFMLLAFTTIFDPRCKMKFIEFVSFKFEGDAGNSQLSHVLEAFHNVFNDYENQFPPAVGPNCSVSEHQIVVDIVSENKRLENRNSNSIDVYAHFIKTFIQPPKSGRKNHSVDPFSPEVPNFDWMCLARAGLLDSDTESESDSDSGPTDTVRELMRKEKERLANPSLAFDCLDEYKHFTQSNWKVHKSELDLYLEEPVFPWSQDLNLLGWWRAASTKYPTLSRMARDFISIPFSFSTNEEAYYTDLRPVDMDLFRLKKDLRKALMCSRTWLEMFKHSENPQQPLPPRFHHKNEHWVPDLSALKDWKI